MTPWRKRIGRKDKEMQCPHCKANNDRVIDSRPVKDYQIRIRRCNFCGYRFRTEEKLSDNPRDKVVIKPMPGWVIRRKT